MSNRDFRTVQEQRATTVSGFLALPVVVAIGGLAVWRVIAILDRGPEVAGLVFWFLVTMVAIVSLGGFFTVQPNEARVLIFFGRYIGSCRMEGFRWGNPLTVKQRISLRVRNLTSDTIKVNDESGSPIEIAAVVVWQIVDSARAIFDVDHYEQFVATQVETAVRTLATRHPYDPRDAEGSEISLRGNQDEIADELTQELQERLTVAGVKVREARLTHLAYATEIAQAMLRRQQAQAVIAARRLIVEAAVGMVEQALAALSAKQIIELDEERKAAMVNNLMVVLTSEQASSPVLNTGSLYS